MMNTKEVRENKETFLQALAAGVGQFKNDFFGSDSSSKAYQDSLTNGQKPVAVVINCADSRQPASLVLGMDPAELFSASSIAAMVHPYGDDKSLHIWSTLEYAINHLGVPYIVQLGHTQCGGCDGLVKTVRKLMAGESLPAAPTQDDHVLAWLKPNASIAEGVLKANPDLPHDEQRALTEIEVLKASTANINAFLKDRHAKGMLKHMPTVIALMYDMKNASLSELDMASGRLSAIKAANGCGCCCSAKSGCCG